jgi:hypothetical protein
MNMDGDRLRLAELASALALATDLAMGQPLEHGLRTTIVAVRLAERRGLDESESLVRRGLVAAKALPSLRAAFDRSTRRPCALCSPATSNG